MLTKINRMIKRTKNTETTAFDIITATACRSLLTLRPSNITAKGIKAKHCIVKSSNIDFVIALATLRS